MDGLAVLDNCGPRGDASLLWAPSTSVATTGRATSTGAHTHCTLVGLLEERDMDVAALRDIVAVQQVQLAQLRKRLVKRDAEQRQAAADGPLPEQQALRARCEQLERENRQLITRNTALTLQLHSADSLLRQARRSALVPPQFGPPEVSTPPLCRSADDATHASASCLTLRSQCDGKITAASSARLAKRAPARLSANTLVAALDGDSGVADERSSGPHVAFDNPSFLKSLPMFHDLSEAQLEKLAVSLERVHFGSGSVIIRQGDVGNMFYILERGAVDVYKHSAATPNGGTVAAPSGGPLVARMTPGDIFGERALLKDEPRAATCIAASEVSCMALERAAFLEVLSAVKELMGEYEDMYADDPALLSLSEHVRGLRERLESSTLDCTGALRRMDWLQLALHAADKPELDAAELCGLMLQSVSKALSGAGVAVVRELDGAMCMLASAGQPLRAQREALCAAASLIHSGGGLRVSLPRNVIATVVCRGKETVPDAALVATADARSEFTSEEVHLLRVAAERLAAVFGKLRVQADRGAVVRSIDVPDSLQVQVQSLALRQGPSGLEARRRFSSFTRRNKQWRVTACLYHGHEQLGPERSTLPMPHPASEADPSFGDTLELSVPVCDLPRAARIVLRVMCGEDVISCGASYLFDHQGIMSQEARRVRLWPVGTFNGVPEYMSGALADQAHNGTAATLSVRCLTTIPRTVAHAVPDVESSVSGAVARAVSGATLEAFPADMMHLLASDPLAPLSAVERVVLWRHREALVRIPASLPALLRAVQWRDNHAIAELHQLLARWPRELGPDALQLLGSRFADSKVRAFAVECLESLPAEVLGEYMLQLTQVLKHEQSHDSALARFLLRRALMHPREIGQQLYWHLRSQADSTATKLRYSIVLGQSFVMNKLLRVATRVSEGRGISDGDQNSRLRQELAAIAFPDRFQLPICPGWEFTGLNVDACRVLRSKKMPLWLVFRREAPLKPLPGSPQAHVVVASGAPPPTRTSCVQLLFKFGDDLRQDQLALQVIQVMNEVWLEAGMDLRMSPYRCVSTGEQQGIIEVVQDACTVGSILLQSMAPSKTKLAIHKKCSAAMAVYDATVLRDWLVAQCGLHDLPAAFGGPLGPEGVERVRRFRHRIAADHMHSLPADRELAYAQAVETFVHSCAGFIMGVGDRHNDNVMLTSSGQLLHIDFGHIMGNFKTKFGMKRERAPFLLTPAFVGVMGGPGSPQFSLFSKLCCDAFLALRRRSNLLLSLFSLMLGGGLPELQTEDDLSWMRASLMLDVADNEASMRFVHLINVALGTRTTLLNDAAHMLRHA